MIFCQKEKNVKEINFILRNKQNMNTDETTREFETEVNDILFNSYDIVQRNKLTHFAESKQMHNFIETNVNIKLATLSMI